MCGPNWKAFATLKVLGHNGLGILFGLFRSASWSSQASLVQSCPEALLSLFLCFSRLEVIRAANLV